MSKNDVTGDKIQTRGPSKAFDEGFDRIFGKTKDFKETRLKEWDEMVERSLPAPKGYTEEELDADNPYNNWMNEK